MRRIAAALAAALVLSAAVVALAVALASGATNGSSTEATTTAAPSTSTPQRTHRTIPLGRGTIGDYGYRVVASTNPRLASANPRVPCVFFEIPKLSGTVRGGPVGHCLTGDYRQLLRRSVGSFAYGAPRKLLPDAQVVLHGLAGLSVARVTLAYTDASGAAREVTARVFRLTRHRARVIGAARRVHFYVAFFPQGLFPRPTARHDTLTKALVKRVFSRIQLTVYDAAGQVIQRQRLGGKRWWGNLLIQTPPGYKTPYPVPSERSHPAGLCPRQSNELPFRHDAAAHRRLVPGRPIRAVLCGYHGLNARTPLSLIDSDRLRNTRRVRHLAQLFNRVPPLRGSGPTSCPADRERDVVARFRYRHSADDYVRVDLTGCGTVTNGPVTRATIGSPSGARLVRVLKHLSPG